MVGVVVCVVVGVVVGVVDGVVVRDEVGVVVCELVTLVVGVVISQPVKTPVSYSSTMPFRVVVVSPQPVSSLKYDPNRQTRSSVRPPGPVNSVIALFSAVAVSAHDVAEAWYARYLTPLSVLHVSVPAAVGHEPRIAFSSATSSLHDAPPRKKVP